MRSLTALDAGGDQKVPRPLRFIATSSWVACHALVLDGDLEKAERGCDVGVFITTVVPDVVVIGIGHEPPGTDQAFIAKRVGPMLIIGRVDFGRDPFTGQVLAPSLEADYPVVVAVVWSIVVAP